jgi:uncharacterized protein (TIGR02391 family)
MNLEARIAPELWAAVAHSYETQNYTHAILDAMALVTEVLREKSGLDLDGYDLAVQALRSPSEGQPRIQINKLQTETERNMQDGIRLTLQGMYRLIRNPRSHERFSDDRTTAEAIILFIDYLLGFVGASYQSFTVQGFLDLVTDPHFLVDAEYVEELVDRVPLRKQSDTLIALYREASWRQADNFELVIKELIRRLGEAGISDLITVVSEDLQTTKKVDSITLVLRIFPDDFWPRIEQMPRLRAEGMLLDELREAWYDAEPGEVNSNAATWIHRIANYYLRKRKLRKVILDKLRSKDFDEHNFVAEFLLEKGALPSIFEDERDVKACVSAVADSVRAGNQFVKGCLVNYLLGSPVWRVELVEELEDLTDPDDPEIYLPDGTPFLGRFEARYNPAREIPF